MDIEKLFELPVFQINGEVNFAVYNKYYAWLSSRLIDGKAKEVALWIDSEGGSVREGLGFYNLSRIFQKATGARIIGFTSHLCASSAFVAFLGCDYRLATIDTQFLIHTTARSFDIKAASAALSDNELVDRDRKEIEIAIENDRRIVEIIAGRTEISLLEVIQMMKKETEFRGKQAIEYGIVDKLITL